MSTRALYNQKGCFKGVEMRDLENKVAIVTGTTGIGKAAAKRLTRGGAHVLACGIDASANTSLSAKRQPRTSP